VVGEQDDPLVPYVEVTIATLRKPAHSPEEGNDAPLPQEKQEEDRSGHGNPEAVANGKIAGLKKRKAKDGFTTWRWVASQVSRQTKGFKPRTPFLWCGLDELAPAELKVIEQECALLNSNLLAWKASGPKAKMIVLGQIYFIADAAGFIKIGFFNLGTFPVAPLENGRGDHVST
jgi:hypothetical protein